MAHETAYQQAASTAASDVSRLAGEVADQAAIVGTEAVDTLERWLKPVGLSVREKPVATFAVVAGAAFAIGALWKATNSRSQSQMSELADHLTGLMRRARW